MAKTGRRGGKLQARGVLRGVSAEQRSAAKEPCQRKANSKESYQVKGWAQIYCNYCYVCAISALLHAQVVSTLPSPHFKSYAAKWWVTNHCKGMRQAGMDGWMETTQPISPHVGNLTWQALLSVLVSKRDSWLLFCFYQPPHLCKQECRWQKARRICNMGSVLQQCRWLTGFEALRNQSHHCFMFSFGKG